MTLTIVDYCRLWSETLQKFISVRKWLSRLTASSFFVRVVQWCCVVVHALVPVSYLLCVFFINLRYWSSSLIFFIIEIFSIWLLYQGSLAPVHRWGFSTSAVTGPQQGGRLALPPGVATKRLSKIHSTEPGWGKILLSTINGFAFWTESFSAGWFRFWSIYFEAAICCGHQENRWQTSPSMSRTKLLLLTLS